MSKDTQEESTVKALSTPLNKSVITIDGMRYWRQVSRLIGFYMKLLNNLPTSGFSRFYKQHAPIHYNGWLYNLYFSNRHPAVLLESQYILEDILRELIMEFKFGNPKRPWENIHKVPNYIKIWNFG